MAIKKWKTYTHCLLSLRQSKVVPTKVVEYLFGLNKLENYLLIMYSSQSDLDDDRQPKVVISNSYNKR